ncbi:MAG: cobalt-precorrin 5A hydrolase [Dethiobacter sp.]|nr:cobalt-precorrin 5A hydrolase [Dethiobacter sp.]
MNGAVLALTPRGRVLALLVGKLTGFTVYLPSKLLEPGDAAEPFDALREALAETFARHRQLVLVMATGIAVRLLAPLLEDKRRDPAVVVLDEAGQHAISLLSGHFGGANDLARSLGEKIGAVPVITTATDVNGLLAIDVLAKLLGLMPEPFALVKEYNAAQLRGETVAVFAKGWPPLCKEGAGLSFLPADSYASQCDRYAWRAVVTDLACWPGGDGDLHLRPASLYVGLGCRRGTAAAQVLATIKQALARHNLACASLAALATIEAKRAEPGLLQAAAELKLPLLFFSAAELGGLTRPYEQSPFVYQTMGVGGVCEPAAILAASGGEVLVKKEKMEGVTVAVARGISPWWELGPAQTGS